MISANPAIANSAAAIEKNNLELAERSGLFRKPTASRMTNKIPATANNIGQSGFRWLAILRLKASALDANTDLVSTSVGREGA